MISMLNALKIDTIKNYMLDNKINELYVLQTEPLREHITIIITIIIINKCIQHYWLKRFGLNEFFCVQNH